jgi:hypothetical protein
MRSSSIACHQRPGWADSGTFGWCSSLLFPFAYSVAREGQVRVPEIGRQASLEFELRHELARLRERLPDLRQEGRAPSAVGQHQAIDAGPQARQRVGLAGHREGLGRRQQRNLDARTRKLVLAQRRKAVVAKSRGEGVFGDVDGQRPVRFEAADAAAQLADRCWVSVTKVAPGSASSGNASTGNPCARPKRSAMALRAVTSSALPRRTSDSVGMVRLRAEGEGAVTDDARAITGGVARIAQVDQLRLQSVPTGCQQQAIDRCRTTGLLMVDMRVEGDDVAGGLAIGLARDAS